MGLAAKEAMPALKGAVTDKDATVRLAVNNAMSRIGTAELVEVLLRSGDHEERASAAFGLGMDYEQASKGLITRGPSAEVAVPGLIEGLADKDAMVRGRAAEALGKFKEKARFAVPGLCARLKDADSWVRNRACFSLGYIGDERAVPALIDALKKPGETERVAAICGLGLIGPAASPAIPYLRALAKDKDKDIRDAVDEALFSIEKKNKQEKP
jgi:HEAT repeat protein